MKKQFNKDDVVMFSQGKYDDYGVEGLYICLTPFCIGDKLLEWACETNRFVRENLSVAFHARVDENPQFVQWIIEKGFVQRVQYTEIHLGDEEFGECVLTHMRED